MADHPFTARGSTWNVVRIEQDRSFVEANLRDLIEAAAQGTDLRRTLQEVPDGAAGSLASRLRATRPNSHAR